MAYKGPSSTSSREGIIRLAGDLGGTFTAPTLIAIPGKLLDNTGNSLTSPGDKYMLIFNSSLNAGAGAWESRRIDSTDVLQGFSVSGFSITNLGALNLEGSTTAATYEVGHNFTSPSSLLSFAATYVSGPPTTATVRDSINATNTSVATGGTFSQALNVTGSTTQGIQTVFTHNATKAAVSGSRQLSITSGIRAYWGLLATASPGTIDLAFLQSLTGTSSGKICTTFTQPLGVPVTSTNVYFYYGSTEVISGNALHTLSNAFLIAGGGYPPGSGLDMVSTPVASFPITNPYGVSLTYYVYRSSGGLFTSSDPAATVTRTGNF